MRIERRITFIIGADGFATWKLNRLKTLSGHFRSLVMLKNISTSESCNVEHTLQVMSLGSKKNQLCQLWIEGSDAELACMVLTDFIDNEFEIVITSHIKNTDLNDAIFDTHPTFTLPFAMSYHSCEINSQFTLEKQALLSRVSTMLSPKKAQLVYDAILNREQVSSTCVGHGIALPHVMLSHIKHASLAVIRLSEPVNWHSARGDINTVIALLIPAPPKMPEVKAFTQLSRALLETEFCQLVTSTTEPKALKAILLHKMSGTSQD